MTIKQRLLPLARVIAAARERYVARGGVSGTLRLPDLTESERVALAGLLPGFVKTRPGQNLTLSLAELDQSLRDRGIAVGLPEAIAAFADAPVQTKAEQLAATEARWDDLMDHLQRLTAGSGPRSRTWVEALAGRTGSAFSVVQREFNQAERSGQSEHHPLRHALSVVATALDRLPADSGRTARLPVFAREIAGDPHAFDETPLAGRLLIRGLTDQLGARMGIEEPPSGALERGILLSAAGLLTDGISSTIVCYGLRGALNASGSPDRTVAGAFTDNAVLVTPLRQVSRWKSLDLPGSMVYVVENPAVFEELVDGLSLRQGQIPALLCTSGFLSVTAVRVLDLAVAQRGRIAYGGDFDLKGLTITAGLIRRYSGQVDLWGMKPEDYLIAAKHPLAEELSSTDCSKLRGLESYSSLAPLVQTMLSVGKRAYQEALIPRLLEEFSP